MAPTLYMIALSPPVRAVQITAKALGIQLNEKKVDLTTGEHVKPEYLKINPQHTVPTLVEDDGFIIWDSHAIMAYLVSKYGKNDNLYPKDLKKRALVDQRLHFDSGVVFTTTADIIRAIIRGFKNSVTAEDCEKVNGTYAFLEVFLDGKKWVASDAVTIADYSLYTTITSADKLVPLDGSKFPKLAAWLQKVDDLPEVQVSKPGLAQLEQLLKSKLKQ